MPPTARPPADDPRLLPFLPMLYVAWADGDLAPEEVTELCAKARSELDEGCREALGAWLDPTRAPSATELQGLLSTIRRRSADLPENERRSLRRLGLELAESGERPVTSAEERALEALEEALGIVGTLAAPGLLHRQRPLAPLALPPPTFEVDALRRRLDGDRREVRDALRRLLALPRFQPPIGASTDDHRSWVLERCRELAAEGYGALSYPEAVGGRGDLGASLATFETLACGDLSLLVKFGVQFGLFGGSILQLGTERHHRRYLPDAGSLALPGCFAMTETGHGSNVADLRTVARYDPATDELVVDTPDRRAQKDYIGNAACDGRLATVFVQLEVGEESHGVHAVLVPIRDRHGAVRPGVTIEDCGEKLGLNGVDNGRLRFRGVRVPRENLLDRFAAIDPEGGYTSPIASPSKRFFTMLGTLVGGRVSIALAANSVAKTALVAAVRYASRRRQFGRPGEPETLLLDYLAHQRRLLPRLATTYGLGFSLAELAADYAAVFGGADGEDDARRRIESAAAGLKAIATWHATDTVQACREACGGQGYLAENRFAALKADSDIFTTFEGDNTVLLQLVARGLLTGLRRQFESMSLLGIARYVASRAAAAVAELNPLITRRSDPEHLRDRDFHLASFRFREEQRLRAVAGRLRDRIAAGDDALTAIGAHQDRVLELAQAHVERVVLERFAAAATAAAEESYGEPLRLLCELYALSRLDHDSGWLAANGWLEGGKAEAIRGQVNELCGELRPHAVALVDAFGLPDELLPPIAR